MSVVRSVGMRPCAHAHAHTLTGVTAFTLLVSSKVIDLNTSENLFLSSAALRNRFTPSDFGYSTGLLLSSVAGAAAYTF